MEVWKDIPGYEGVYQVSDLGRVKSFMYGKTRILKGGKTSHGYLSVVLSGNSKLISFKVHTLVVIAFLNHHPDGTNKIVCDHINHIKTDNRLVNLQLITNRKNCSKDRINYSSQYIGVGWDKSRSKWKASIQINGRETYLGSFDSEIEASQAYQNKLNQ